MDKVNWPRIMFTVSMGLRLRTIRCSIVDVNSVSILDCAMFIIMSPCLVLYTEAALYLTSGTVCNLSRHQFPHCIDPVIPHCIHQPSCSLSHYQTCPYLFLKTAHVFVP